MRRVAQASPTETLHPYPPPARLVRMRLTVRETVAEMGASLMYIYPSIYKLSPTLQGGIRGKEPAAASSQRGTAHHAARLQIVTSAKQRFALNPLPGKNLCDLASLSSASKTAFSATRNAGYSWRLSWVSPERPGTPGNFIVFLPKIAARPIAERTSIIGMAGRR